MTTDMPAPDAAYLWPPDLTGLLPAFQAETWLGQVHLITGGTALRLYLADEDAIVHVTPGDPGEWLVDLWLICDDRQRGSRRQYRDPWGPRADTDRFALLAEVFLLDAPDPLYRSTVTLHPSPENDPPPGLYDEYSDVWPLQGRVASAAREMLLQADTRDLHARVPGLTVGQAGGLLPFQSEGTWHGHPYYFRYRGGTASLRVGGPDVVSSPLWNATVLYGHAQAGCLDMDEFTYLFCVLGRKLQQAEYRYTFDLREGFHPDPDLPPASALLGINIGQWARSGKEATERLTEWLAALAEQFPDTPAGFTIDDVILTGEDTRAFPDPAPDFAVLSVPAPPRTDVGPAFDVRPDES